MRAHTASPSLSLAELEAFDPGSGSGDERRHLCPLCGPDHRQDAAHRCGASGLLVEHQTHLPSPGFTGRAVSRQPPTPEPAPASGPAPWAHLRLSPVAGTDAERYLAGRGLPVPLPAGTDARWCAAFGQAGGSGRPAVVFAVRDGSGAAVAVQGRFVYGGSPKAMTLGPVSHGLFVAPGALAAEVVVVCEAPIDALALTAAGIPALATCGSRSSWPAWFAERLAGKALLLAQDADAAGDRQAVALGTAAAKAGATVFRLRPPTKDWAQSVEQRGWPALREALVSAVGAGEAPEPSAAPDGTPEAPTCTEGAAADLCRVCGVPTPTHDHWHHGWVCQRCWPAVAEAIGPMAPMVADTTLSDIDREVLVAWGLTIGRCATCGQEDTLPSGKPTRRCRMTHRCTGPVRQEG